MHYRNRSAPGGSGFGRGARRVLRFTVLLLVLIMVACIGLVIGTGQDAREPSTTERALAASAAAARELSETAGLLAANASGADASAYESMSEIFGLHAEALEPAGNASDAQPSGLPATGQPSPDPTSPSPSSDTVPSQPRDLLGNLAQSYTQAFSAAATSEPGPARLLASVATAQWLQARSLASRLGASLPAIPVPAPRYDDAPACPADLPLQPDAGLEGTRLAVLAEYRATYAYEVAAARAADPQLYLSLVVEHDGAATAGAAVLTQQCVAPPLPAVAYALKRNFLAETAESLQLLESGLVETYADLVGVSRPGLVRTWAIRQLAETAQRAAGDGTGAADAGQVPFPGMDPGESPEEPGR